MPCAGPPTGSDISVYVMEKIGSTFESRQRAVELLFAEKCSCVICNGGETRIFRERGVKDLYRLLREEPEFLDGAFVADKVVGKAAAALMILGGVAEVFADVVSTPALELFRRSGVAVEHVLEVDHIINRTKTGWCPLETRCHALQTPEACLARIEEFIQTKNK